jgi:hypothetical protein
MNVNWQIYLEGDAASVAARELMIWLESESGAFPECWHLGYRGPRGGIRSAWVHLPGLAISLPNCKIKELALQDPVQARAELAKLIRETREIVRRNRSLKLRFRRPDGALLEISDLNISEFQQN